MNVGRSSSGQRTRLIPAALLATTVTLAWLGLSGDTGLAGEIKDPARFTKASEYAAARDAKQKSTRPTPAVSAEQATQIALKTMPGEVTSVVIERKRGRQVYVVEIQTPNKGERDVFVDIETGEVVGTD